MNLLQSRHAHSLSGKVKYYIQEINYVLWLYVQCVYFISVVRVFRVLPVLSNLGYLETAYVKFTRFNTCLSFSGIIGQSSLPTPKV